MKEKQGRGLLTERIKKKSLELFGYEMDQTELRLIPYILYQAQNEKMASNTNDEELEIISKWIDSGFLSMTGLGNILSISEDFWNKANQIVYLGYVDLAD